MKKILVAMFALCGVSQAVIMATNVGATSYKKATLDPAYAYAIVYVPKGRGVVGDVIINNAPAQCQNASIGSDFFEEVCLLGKREKAERAANIQMLKNNKLYESGTIIYSLTK